MRNLRWICWYLWEGLPTLLAFPIDSSRTSGTSDFWSSQWENHWSRYVIGTLGFVVVVFTLAGCLCCRRQRRPKGFQDDAGTDKEFKDGSTAGTETTIERVPSSSLELEVPRISTSSREKIQFDEYSCNFVDTRSTIKPPSSSLYSDNDDANNLSRERPCHEWYEGENFPREKLKYLREIGRGWFGKVVEGTTLIEDEKITKLGKNRGVVVRILTEEATTREKSWFLGESTPYLKLSHPNVLQLLGFCLETDPYLLLFESCPAGDLKHFLIANRENGDALRKENLPTRMALNIANALEHMHDNGFAHTDLSARNCLVGPDLTAKLGDYGIGVEKYPSDYYVVGDRALPIRWSAPESLECTETTIETRAITPLANIWSYGVLLWEIASWAQRPYDDLGDEQVIEIIFSLKSDFTTDENSIKLLNKLIVKCDLPINFREALEATWKFLPSKRSSLRESREILCGKRIENFEKRWENLRPNASSSVDKSASLQDLRGSVDSELWQANSCVEKNSLRANFRLGPEEPVINCTSLRENFCQPESGSETEEESWRGRVERGAYTEKVKQKSKSAADLMILVHIDSDSDVESSLGPQNIEKTVKKRLPPSGSDGDLRSAVIADEFDEALRKLRDPTVSNGAGARMTKNIIESVQIGNDIEENMRICNSIVENVKINENIEKPKLLTLTNQGQTPILRLSFGTPAQIPIDRENDKNRNDEESCTKTGQEEKTVENHLKILDEMLRNEEHVLRLVSKGNPDLPVLRYVPERTSTPENHTDKPSFDSFLVLENRDAILSSQTSVENSVDVERWNDALAHELEKKNPAYVENTTIFDEPIKRKTNYFPDSAIITASKEDFYENVGKSAPNTSKWLQSFSVASSIGEDHVSCSSSTPETPLKSCLHSSMEKVENSKKITKNVNYYRDDDDMIMGSSSAPETPFRANYNVTDRDEDSSNCEDLEERIIAKDSAPDTPQSRGNYSVGNGDEDSSSTGEELEPGMLKRSSHEADDEEDRKHLSTPDDERSSDSGFRDKESCEEEESPIPCPQVSSIILGVKNSSVIAGNSSPLSASAEEEQMRILFELDTILDAEYYGNFRDSDNVDESEISLENMKIHFDDNDEIVEKIRSISESHESTETTEILKTVRANSCEPNFLDNFLDKNKDTNDESPLEFLNEENSVDLLESTEADSVSELFKIEENRSNSKKEDLLADSSSESPIKTDKNPSTDSSIELVRLNLDSSSFRDNIETTDLSSETLSAVVKNESNSETSSIKTNLNLSTDLSLDLRHETFSRDEIPEISAETENSLSSVRKTNPANLPLDDTSEINEEIEKSSSPASIRDKRKCPQNETSAIPEESENSTSSRVVTNLGNFPPDDAPEIHEEMEISTSSLNKTDQQNFSQETSEILKKTENTENDKIYVDNFSRYVAPKMREESENFTRSVGGTDSRNVPGESSPVRKMDGRNLIVDEMFENCEETENSLIDSPLKLDDNQPSDVSVDLQRDGGHSYVEQWSSRENINEINDNDDEDSSTMSLRSDNSYVSFGLDEEFVAAIRNELREKLPRAQMPVVEALDPHDDKETASINTETSTKSWGEEDEIDENSERSSVDISIRYNIYGTPLSPIMEERESAGTSESLVSKEDSGDASIASRVSALSEDVLVVDTRTNQAIIVKAGANGGNPENSHSQQDDDRDTSHGDFSDEENLEYPQNHLNRGFESKRISMGSGGAPLPSPEEESKWQQQFPLPLQMQDDLMSTSFGTDRDWDSQDDEEGEDEAEEGEEDEEENSSSSGEFVWKRYDESHGDLENVATRSPPNKPKSQEPEADLDEDEEEGDEDDDEEEEEFTPSAWDATLAPHRSALRSPEKNLKSGDQKKSVWFKKQRYHCVYEYPKETPVVEGQGQAATTWEPTSYADWEEMMDEPRLDIYPMEYDETNRAGDEEFYVSSSNRPFQFQSGEGKYVSQFFPGASTTLLQHENQHQVSSASSSSREADDLQSSQDEVDRADSNPSIVLSSQTNGNSRGTEFIDNQQQTQLGELRHTRDRLKLNLLSTSGSTRTDEEVGNEKRAGDWENIEKTNENAGKTEENIEQIDKAERTEGNAENTEEMRGKPENLGEKEESSSKSENAGILVDNDENIDESTAKIEENLVKTFDKSDNETMKLITPITTERLSSNDKFYDMNKISIVQENIDSKIDEFGESSNPKILDNLAVKQASKIENNEEKEKKESFVVEKSTIDNRNIIDNKIKEKEESKTFHSDAKNEEVGATREDSKHFGDQKQETSRSRVKNDTRNGEILDIPKLESGESLSITDESTNAAIAVNTTTNNSTLNGENIDEIKKAGMVQSSSQS